MNRRFWLKQTALGTSLAALSSAAIVGASENKRAAAADEKNRTLMRSLKITGVKAILTAPSRSNLIVVKIQTNEPELYGLGCATFTQRARAVETAVNHFLHDFLLGKNPLQIEDTWQSVFVSSYWRNGPVLGNALSGVDMALWDILGKVSGLPIYQLLGGKARQAVDVYRHASGADIKEVTDNVLKFKEEGYRYIRAQMAIPGYSAYGVHQPDHESALDNKKPYTFEPRPYVRAVPKLFEHLRHTVGDDVELLHDVHERVPPILAIQLAKDLEPYKLFFLEDPFSPEDVGYFKHLRAQTSTPIAMGELFNNPNEWLSLVSGRLIDFIRVHISQVGGLTMARKIAALCEFFRVRTAWHGPGDVSPVGHACNVHLDLAVPNFGIQEAREFSEEERDVFPGAPELRDGYYHVSDRPGFGVDINEKLAARFPIKDNPPFPYRWGNVRRRDGSVVKP